MRRSGLRLALALGSFAWAAGQAEAQPRAEVHGYLSAGIVRLAAAQSFEATTGSANARALGAGVHVGGLWQRWFADVAVMQTSKTGGRIDFEEDPPVALDIPLRVRLRYVDVAGGWRHRHGRVAVYGGGGVSRVAYDERSDFAPPDESVSDAGTGSLVLAGVDVRVARWLQVGGELRIRRILGVLGEGGISQQFGERSAGGVAAALRLSIGG